MHVLLGETKEAISHQTKQQERRHEDGKSEECLRELFQTNPKDDRERIIRRKDNTPTLFKSSYEWILNVEEFRRWRTDPESRRLWIRGDPGKGKTMLLCGIIEELEKSDPRPLCYFFCQATVPALDNATSVLRSLVLQLAQKYPWLRNQVLAVYENGGKARFNDHNAWGTMYELLNSMLSDPQLDGVLLIVDALDECTTDRAKLLQFIKNLSTISRAKVIISSRKWTEIGEVLGEDDTNGSTITLELHDDLISKAVHLYIDREVQQLASRKRFNEITCSEIRLYLRTQSQDTFLWVSLVCQALLDGSVKKRNVMKVLETFPPGLDAFYERMISSLPLLEEDLYKEILSVMSILKRPVTIEELLPLLQSHFSDDTESLKEAIESCGSFLKIQAERIYFVHQSAVEFLKSSASKLSTVAERHKSVFWRSMDVLNRPGHLKRDIYGLKKPSTSIAEIYTPEPDPLRALQYFCTYWVDHLTDWVCEERTAMGKPHPQEDRVISEVDSFLSKKFLNWIEALSLLRQIRQAIQAIQKLQVLFNQNPNSIEQGLSAFINDANRFLLRHRVLIENTPLQLYASALFFSPEQSVVKAQFRDEAPDWVTITPGLEETWSACLQTLEYDVELAVRASTVAYSPDGEWLVTRYDDGTVRLWHAKSSTCTHTVSLESEEDVKYSVCVGAYGPKSVAFSADGSSFVSSSRNGVVKVWDRDTGRCTHQLEPHTSSADLIAISSDGSTVASYVLDSIIIRSTKGEFPTRTVECCPGRGVMSIALNANGQWIASGSTNRLLEIFDTSRSGRQQISTDHHVATVAWSPDGDWVASGGVSIAETGSIVIWERRTGKSILKIKYEVLDGSASIAIPCYMDVSADKEFLAAGSGYDICVWNTSTGALTWAMYGSGISQISSISFSPDTQRIVSASWLSTIKVWDLSIIGEAVSRFPEDRGSQLTFADEDHFFAYYPGMERIRLWGRGADIPESRFYEKYASAIALSQDRQQLASASSLETTITIWNTSTLAITMKVCSCIEHICFDARDSRESVCQQRHWVSRSATMHGIDSLAFGNASQLFSSSGGLIKIWDTSNGSCSQTIDSGHSCATNITVSSQGQRLAFLAYDNDERGDGIIKVRVKVWDIVTNQCISMFSSEHTPFNLLQSLSFSADMQQLASSTEGYLFPAEIFLWDLRSGSRIRTCMFKRYKMMSIKARFDTRIENRLHTEYGFFDTRDLLEPSSSGSNYAGSEISGEDFEHTPDSESSETMPSFHGYGLSYDLEWITGYLTPSYLDLREKEIAPFNMACWLTSQIQECTLNLPAAIHHFAKDEVRQLLEVAAELNYDTAKAEKSDALSELAAEMEQKTKVLETGPSAGYFIRTSHCSPKDADGGNLQPVGNMREALVKLVSSKRTVQALLSLFYQFSQNGKSPDDQLYFFPYYTHLDRLSEWRCYVKEGHIVAISQSRFYQPNHAGITDEMLRRLATQARYLWLRIAPDLNFKSCILDVYAEVLNPDFEAVYSFTGSMTRISLILDMGSLGLRRGKMVLRCFGKE
ncbi:hypothetical protein CSIM01_09686 [Colletotrichum simmondsii]|uniref:NACHT domain-containing protein n=1 Tax=Colletotrichum simmondsii TaxID=703756 RepID=A0A135TBZ9_9PEZI|nr:hypothetical protein CSIM01_09686 [Colletotrichum simmondsii]